MATTRAAKRAALFIGERWAVFFLILLLVVFGLVAPNFFAVKNFSNILYYATTYLLLAAGETFVIVSGGIDLSVGFVMGLVSVASSMIMRDLFAAGVAQPACMVIGAAAGLILGLIPGLINGILVARFRVPPFIATLGMYGVANGVALNLSEGFPITFLPPRAGEIGNSFLAYVLPGKYFGFFRRPAGMSSVELRELVGIVPTTVIVTAVVLAVFAFLLVRTRFGQHTYAIGGSQDAALRAGINVPAHLVRIYVISSCFAAIAGVLYVFRAGIGNFTTMGASYELFAIAAVVIGGASLFGGKGGIGGTIIGVLILMTLENGLNIIGVQAFYRYIATGVILILAVVIDQLAPEREAIRA
ncbi:MAG: ABC transporter permease [Spirochaetales bacterium]|nr:ABC transporter permease [Spirochaetales bacterium]